MYEQQEATIYKKYEKNLKRKVIPGLLSIKNVKPKELHKNKHQHVTHVHDSIEGQNALKPIESIENENKQMQNQKKKKTKQKDKEKELFQKCKAKCVCSGIWAAKGLKQCTVQHEMKKSTSSKASCCIDGLKPRMITTVTATLTRRKVKYEERSDCDENDKFKKRK